MVLRIPREAAKALGGAHLTPLMAEARHSEIANSWCGWMDLPEVANGWWRWTYLKGLGWASGLSGSCQGAMGSAFSPAKCSATVPEINKKKNLLFLITINYLILIVQIKMNEQTCDSAASFLWEFIILLNEGFCGGLPVCWWDLPEFVAELMVEFTGKSGPACTYRMGRSPAL